MRSFTSSSKRRRREVTRLALGVWVALALVAFAALFPPDGARAMDIVTHRAPPSPDFYLAHDRGGHIDHHVLYHDIDPVIRDRLHAADVLFLGNSRLMFALEPNTIRNFFAHVRRTYYVLGFGHEEQDTFPLEIIRSRNLRPSLVVINADHFFKGERSEWAARVVEESDFDARKIQWEGEWSHRVRRVIHRVVPHYVDWRRRHREVVLYRSRQDGTWFIANDFGLGRLFDWPPGDRDVPEPAALLAADTFKRELAAQGTRLVLCVIPGPGVSLHSARVIADRLSVPLIVPDVPGLRTIDNSHLSHDSAMRVAARLLDDLRAYWP